MLSDDVFRDQPTLSGPRVRLEPMRVGHFDGLRPMYADPDGRRLTGTHREFTTDRLRHWMATRQEHSDRADWVIVGEQDGEILGEVVLNHLDPDNSSVSFRIGLLGPAVFGKGYGTEATRLVVDYALDEVGLHRVSLEVFDFNLRAQRVYEKCGFIREGVQRDALRWDGEWHDSIVMAILSTDPRPWRADKPAHKNRAVTTNPA